ncbi:Transketolase [Pestalotiopsis sp. 9143b]|nr:Transketolase [Pestalotiopsis sp. 9143b]
MAASYNRPGFDLFDNRTFVFFGDGCAMEGVASEAASLAGHLQLGNLIALYDDNSICIDGSTASTFTEDVDKRFEAYGWHVQRVTDGDSDLAAIAAAVGNALAIKDRPSMIRVKTTIGYGSKLQGTASVHGNPLKLEDLEAFKQKMKLSTDLFSVPDDYRSTLKMTRRAAMNGIAAYGANLIPVAGTFLNFVSYAAPALRLSALSQLRVIWITTHDSQIGLGGDGPTHQPIETNETAAAYYMALTSKTSPSVLALARQDLPQLPGSSREKAARGAYVLLEDENAAITLVSTGSEVSLCLKAAALLSDTHDVKARVVSMPCMEVFDKQPLSYQLSVLTQGIPVLSVEALSTNAWSRFSHEQFGINEFGLSGTAEE